ncbi:MAG: phosphohistidine phosphatase SixA [Bacteroidales bacterium]|nr:phosphohistidine phosphatase SixA [Bacteroidales bacterium]
MRIFMVQHGEAKTKEEDPDRLLSDIGVYQVKKMAGWLSKKEGLEINELLHSGKNRAEQTAEILAGAFKPPMEIERADYMNPGDNPKIWADRLGKTEKNIMLVGHLPHLSKLASHLLTGSMEKEIVQFKNAGIVCLNRNGAGTWLIEWMIIPEIV